MVGTPKVSTSELGLPCTQGLPVSLAAGRGVTAIGARARRLTSFTLSFSLLA